MFELKISGTDFDQTIDNVDERVAALLPDVVQRLAQDTWGFIRTEAGRKLHSSRRLYLENCTVYPDSNGTWVIELLKPAHWIEDGREKGSMVDSLLNGPGVKTNKHGERYKIVPFHHNKPPSQMTETQVDLRNTIREVFKEHGIPWGQPTQMAERNRAEGFVDGGDKFTNLGNNESAPGESYGPHLNPAQRRLSTKLLGKLNIMDKPLKTGEGVGQGQGPVGAVRQGMTGIPHLQGVRIYQNEIKTTHGDLVTQKDVTTFRTVTEKHKQEGRWEYPGVEGRKFFEPAFMRLKNKWETELKPQIEASLRGS
jgi:hypothetical protein